MTIPKGITVEHVRQAIGKYDAGVVGSFGEPTKYELVYDGKHYPPKDFPVCLDPFRLDLPRVS